MKRLWFVGAGVGAIAVGFLIVADAPEPQAADHGDSPAVLGTPLTDILDHYAWMNAGSDQLNLVMTVHRDYQGADAVFDTEATYRFHIVSTDADDETEEHTIDCTFAGADPQQVTCTQAGEALNTHTSDVDAVEATPGNSNLRAFAGVRDDPFFFNLAGFGATATFVGDNADSLSFNGQGCPTLTDGTAEALVDCLSTACDVGPGEPNNAAAENGFAGESVLAIVVTIDKAALGVGEVTPDTPITFHTWVSTLDVDGNQIDRAGRPAISTALIDPFNLDPDHDQLKNDYNTDDDPANWATAFQETIETNLAILDALDSTGPQ